MNILKAWCIRNKFFYLTFVLISIGVFIEIDAAQNFRVVRGWVNDDNSEFLVFSSEDYQKELTVYDDALNKQEKQILKRKFDQAQTFSQIGDIEKAIKHYNALLIGNDEYGELKKINSFVVLNNIGIIYFKEKRNKDFEFLYI